MWMLFIVINLAMNEIRLIIIEEHTAVRDALKVRLESSVNLEVVAAYGSAADWKACQQEKESKADVVLLGLKSVRQRPLTIVIRDIKEFSESGVAVLVLASLADDVEKELVLQAGARRYLLKDINSNQLIAEIEALAPSHIY
jgi:DNA-binding NarL/FixJ family response regulator